MKRLLAVILAIFAAALLSARAQSPDDQYIRIYTLMQQADALSDTGQSSQALEKYLEAQSSLKRLQQVFPSWSPKVVAFRLTYLEGKIATLTAKVPTPVTTAKPAAQAAPAAAAPAPNDADRKLAAMAEEVRGLQNDKTVLEAKLKEALATQPAAIDPRELNRAEEKIQSLMKENDLLKVAIARQQGESGSGASEKTLEETRQALADATRKLSEQTERANTLALERESTLKQLKELNAASGNAADLEKVKKEIETANAGLAEQNERANKLAAEKDALQSRLNTLSASADAAEALRAENQILKKQLSELKSRPATGESSQQNDQLAQAQASLAALQSDAEILRLEKTALQDRIKEASAGRETDAQRVKQLESERDDLKKQLASREKGGFFHRRSKADIAKIKELSQQVESYRARVEVLEARATPYTPEELALLQKPPPQLEAAATKTSDKVSKEPPAGTAALAAEAQRLFAAKQFDKAEQKYLEILRQDESNVYTLANLAAIQLEMGHLDEAEKHAKQALVSAPNDAYSLSILGYLKFRQEKYDEALDFLSRAAQADPRNAEIQNYLGIALSHKGMRDAAETALRKAIQIEPNYASAHNNLAVIYATEQPPWMGLARWHYQKALAAGHPHNQELEKLLGQPLTNVAPIAP